MDMTFDQWLKLGYDNGWCGPDVCETHDGLPLSDEEANEFEESDPCINIIRLYDSPETKTAVEEAHSPSVWRATNKGW
jgi:hypothetical protein